MTKVTSVGGNQYDIECNSGRIIRVDLDGLTLMTDEDFAKIEEAGLDHDTMSTPADCASAYTGEELEAHMAATMYAINYSGFNADIYISENKQ